MKRNDSLTLRPFHYVSPSITFSTVATICVLAPQILLLFFTSSYDALLKILCCVVSSALVEALDALVIRRRPVNVPVTLLQGILIGMFLPSLYPAVSAFIIVFMTMLIAKYSFGGIAGSWVNPVVAAVIIAYFIGAIWFPGYIMPVEYLQTEKVSLQLISDGVFPVHSFDAGITRFLNNSLFSSLRASLPEGYVSLLWDSGADIPAFRFNLLTLVGSLVLFSIRSLSWEAPASYLVSYCGLVWLFCPVFAGGHVGTGDVLLALFTGGTLFTAFFVLNWFGTVPMTVAGRLVYGGLTGVAAFFIAGYGLSSTGAIFSVFCGNIFSLLIQMVEYQYGQLQAQRVVSDNFHRMQEGE